MKLDKLFYSIPEAGDILAVSRHTIARDCRLGLIAAKRYGRRVLIPRDEILRIANDGMAPASQAHPQVA